MSAFRTVNRQARKPAEDAASKYASPRTRSMLAKIHIAKKELGLEDDDYRAVLLRVTGKLSSGGLADGQLQDVLDEFKRLGWVPVLERMAGAPAGRAPRAASHPAAGKARALWISLAMLGVIRSRSEQSLEAFARRQLGCTQMAWADQGKVYKLIEALKAIAERNGWSQDTAGLDDPIWTLKLRLCEAILRKCKAHGAIGTEITMGQLVRQRTDKHGVAALSQRDLEALANQLGKRLADHVADDYYGDDDQSGPHAA